MQHRSPSPAVSTSLSALPPALRLLKLINPKAKAVIRLDDIRRLLQAVPSASKEQVRAALEKYTAETKSMKMTNDQFLEYMNKVPSVGGSLKTDENSKQKVSPKCMSPLNFDRPAGSRTLIPKHLQSRIRTLSQERQFITYDSDLAVGAFRLTPAPQVSRGYMKERRHRRTASLLDQDTAQGKREGRTRENETRGTSPESRMRTGDSSYVGSCATTPKKSHHILYSPAPAKSPVPSLKAGISLLLQQREALWSPSNIVN